MIYPHQLAAKLEHYKRDELPAETEEALQAVARAVLDARRADRPVILFTGAHAIKNGLGPLLIDLVERGLLTHIAGNGATSIHDFELALIGQTSEDVPQALEVGSFGMATEFALQNAAVNLGYEQGLGYGESLGQMICDEEFRTAAIARLVHDHPKIAASLRTTFDHPEVSLLATCCRYDVPFTVHVSIGTDVLDQHPCFCPEAKGGASGYDFLIYTKEVTRLTEGGVVINLSSAVTGPEVLLKAVSMAANIGAVPYGLVTADFDLRPFDRRQMTDESAPCYYHRDQKSVVTRIPAAFHGHGHYIQGNQLQTLPRFWELLGE
ncbi:MAG: hypothetical protein PVH19_12445 [Planctomycetia bacterium]